jgi:hypothetical protein
VLENVITICHALLPMDILLQTCSQGKEFYATFVRGINKISVSPVLGTYVFM